jgi:anti-sigma factor RsiW
MNEEHVIRSYHAWDEDRLTPEERRAVERHLTDCESCREYFEKMSALLAFMNPSLLPRLEADPFVPTRARATVDGRRGARSVPFGKAAAWLRVSLAGVVTLVAVTAGVYLGKGLATTQSKSGDTEIVTAYYEALAQTGFAGDWGDVIEEEEER